MLGVTRPGGPAGVGTKVGKALWLKAPALTHTSGSGALSQPGRFRQKKPCMRGADIIINKRTTSCRQALSVTF